jgi:putative MFS transporter
VLLKVVVDGKVFFDDRVLNHCLLLGILGGMRLVTKLSRRSLTIWSFGLLTVSMSPMAIRPDAPTRLLFPVFLVFTVIMATAVNPDLRHQPSRSYLNAKRRPAGSLTLFWRTASRMSRS